MSKQQKLSPKKRQQLIFNLLKDSNEPITGNDLAKQTNVSRQVIVQDVSILKAKNKPIIATSQGYLYIDQQPNTVQDIVAVNHTPNDTQKELYLIVDHGVTVKNVMVEHPVYGELTASIMVSSRAEVDQFIKRVTETNATYLSILTHGTHLHTFISDSTEKIELAKKALKKEGFLLDS